MALVATPVDGTRPSAPVYEVRAVAALAASASAATDHVDCAGFERATVYVSASGNPTVTYLELSLDGLTWHFLVNHGDTPAAPAYTTSGGVSSTVRRVELAGARFLRATIFNTSAGSLSVGCQIALSGEG